ncbi:MAG: tetratricopeptide repeat protein [Gemmatimonadales bacterium]|nr:tetratricopeptide repeat protein [Gemmatimonadales bacterium]MDQ3426532.1 tetratricopeptide repeat protein [Gemmatimonadota bacterium]
MHGKALKVLRARRVAGRSLVAIANYASGLSQLGRYEEALPLLRESVARSIAEQGPEHVLVGAAQLLAFTLFYLGRYAEADTLARRSYEIRKKALGPQHTEKELGADPGGTSPARGVPGR